MPAEIVLGGKDDTKAADDAAAKAAADKVTDDAATKAAADKAVVDKAAADKVAADHVAAGKNPDGTAKDAKASDGVKAPVVPEKYELKPPEKSILDAADLDAIKVEAKALGLTQEQAQRVVEARSAGWSKVASDFLEGAKADSDLGGANFDRNVALAERGLNEFLKGLPEDEQQYIKTALITKTGAGNYKGILRAFRNLAKRVGEDTPLSGHTPGAEPKPGSTAAITAKLYPGTPGAGL